MGEKLEEDKRKQNHVFSILILITITSRSFIYPNLSYPLHTQKIFEMIGFVFMSHKYCKPFQPPLHEHCLLRPTSLSSTACQISSTCHTLYPSRVKTVWREKCVVFLCAVLSLSCSLYFPLP